MYCCFYIYFFADNFRRRDTMQQGMVNFQYDDVSELKFSILVPVFTHF